MVEPWIKRSWPVRRAAGAAVLLLLLGRPSHPRTLPACSIPRVDTAGWIREEGPYGGYTFLLPPTFRKQGGMRFSHGGVAWLDSAREFSLANGYWAPASFRGSYAEEPPSDPEYSECWDTIGGLRVFLSARYFNGTYIASGWFPDPRAPAVGFRGMDIVLGGRGTSRQDQQLMLAIVRTVVPDSAR